MCELDTSNRQLFGPLTLILSLAGAMSCGLPVGHGGLQVNHGYPRLTCSTPHASAWHGCNPQAAADETCMTLNLDCSTLAPVHVSDRFGGVILFLGCLTCARMPSAEQLDLHSNIHCLFDPDRFKLPPVPSVRTAIYGTIGSSSIPSAAVIAGLAHGWPFLGSRHSVHMCRVTFAVSRQPPDRPSPCPSDFYFRMQSFQPSLLVSP